MNKQEVVFVGDLVMEDGKTWKEKNMEIKHNIPLGSLVEINIESDGDHDVDPDSLNGVRLFVCEHSRDCDGTPLYSLSHDKNASVDLKQMDEEIKNKVWLKHPNDYYYESLLKMNYQNCKGKIIYGYDEESLQVIS